MKFRLLSPFLVLFALAVFGCADGLETESLDAGDPDESFLGDGKSDSIFSIEEGSNEAEGILELVNTASLAVLDDPTEVGLDHRAATNIVSHRDRESIDTLRELDSIPWVGRRAFGRLYHYAESHGYFAAPNDAWKAHFPTGAFEQQVRVELDVKRTSIGIDRPIDFGYEGFATPEFDTQAMYFVITRAGNGSIRLRDSLAQRETVVESDGTFVHDEVVDLTPTAPNTVEKKLWVRYMGWFDPDRRVIHVEEFIHSELIRQEFPPHAAERWNNTHFETVEPASGRLPGPDWKTLIGVWMTPGMWCRETMTFSDDGTYRWLKNQSRSRCNIEAVVGTWSRTDERLTLRPRGSQYRFAHRYELERNSLRILGLWNAPSEVHGEFCRRDMGDPYANCVYAP